MFVHELMFVKGAVHTPETRDCQHELFRSLFPVVFCCIATAVPDALMVRTYRLWSSARFNLVRAVDIVVDHYHGNQLGLAAMAAELCATYALPRQ
jgi:hypothetical protein